MKAAEVSTRPFNENGRALIEPLLDIFCQEGLVFRDLSKFTIQWWSRSTHIFMKRTGIRYVEDLTPDVIRQYFFEGRIQRGWSSGTYTNYYLALNVFFKWLVKRGHLERNPLDGLERPRPGKRIPKSIREEDARVLLEAALHMRYAYQFERYRNHAFVSLLLFTGLRLSEALNLGLGDVNLEDNMVTVRGGKWNKDRVIPMALELRSALSNYLQDRNRLIKKQCPKFFVSLRGQTPWTPSGVRRLINRLRKVTRIHFSPHLLRHTFCTMMANNGADLLTLQQMMGHSTIETTMIYITAYGHKTKTEMLKHPLSRQECFHGSMNSSTSDR